jgi:hypothetical protein
VIEVRLPRGGGRRFAGSYLLSLKRSTVDCAVNKRRDRLTHLEEPDATDPNALNEPVMPQEKPR